MLWEAEAEAALKRVPAFVRKMVRKRVEEYAEGKGCSAVTLAEIEEARSLFKQERPRKSQPGSALWTCGGSSVHYQERGLWERLAPLSRTVGGLRSETRVLECPSKASISCASSVSPWRQFTPGKKKDPSRQRRNTAGVNGRRSDCWDNSCKSSAAAKTTSCIQLAFNYLDARGSG